jgi:phosphinothricin acetyltransferase
LELVQKGYRRKAEREASPALGLDGIELHTRGVPMSPLIRVATLADAEQVQAIYGPYCSTPVSFELEPPSVGEMRQRLAKVLEQYPWLVCEHGGEVLGYAYAGPHRERAAYGWSVDTSAYVGRLRCGIGRALYTSLFALLRLQGFVNAYAGVTLPNPASVGLHEAMGFRPVGVYREVGYKCGAWHDVAWYQLLLQPRPSQPMLPRALSEVRQDVNWEAALNAGLPLLHL